MTTIVTVLPEGYADWKTALLNATARGHLGARTLFATQGERPVTSAGGLKAVPHLAVEAVDVDALYALVVNGGTAWAGPDAPDVADLLRRARAAGKVVAGICDGTLALARAGLLDAIAHTSNAPDALAPTGYAGQALHRDGPGAVRDGRLVTAPGTAPVTFMARDRGPRPRIARPRRLRPDARGRTPVSVASKRAAPRPVP